MILRLLLALVSALSLYTAAEASGAGVLRLRGTSISTICADDGSAAGPAGTPQYPLLLSGYVTRSACTVWGVDRYTGRPQSGLAAMKVPGVDTPPTGWSYNAGSKILRCDSAAGTTLENWDLTGVSLLVSSTCSGTTIRYMYFETTTTACNIIQFRGPNTTIEYSTVNGGGLPVGLACDYNNIGEGIYFLSTATGTQTAKYLYVYNQPQHFLSFSSATIDFRYSLIEGCGFFQGAHCNGMQTGGDTANSIISYNTFYSAQPYLPLGATAGTFTSGSPTITGINVGGPGNQNSLRNGASITGALIPGGTTILSSATSGGVTTITMSANATGTGSSTFDVPNTWPTGLTIGIRYASQFGGNMTNGTMKRNTIIAIGPIPTISYGIYCVVEDGTNVGADMSDNYFDNTGATGAFYPGGGQALCSGRTGSGNKNMVTGATIPIP